MQKTLSFFTMAMLVIFSFEACKKDDPTDSPDTQEKRYPAWAQHFGNDAGFTEIIGSETDNNDDIVLYFRTRGTIDVNGELAYVPSRGGGAIAKYSSQGQIQFAKAIPRAGEGGVLADVVLDDQDNIYACGNFQGTMTVDGQSMTSLGSSDIFIVKFSPIGSVIWMKQFGIESRSSTSNSITVDLDQNVTFSGYITDTFTFAGESVPFTSDQPYFFAQLDVNGEENWMTADWNGYTTGMDVDNQGNFYAVGRSVAKYTSGGAQLWDYQKGESKVSFNGVEVNGSNVLVTGAVAQPTIFDGGNYNFTTEGSLLVQYSSNGTLDWAYNSKGLNGQSALDERTRSAFYGATVDASGNIYATGVNAYDYDIVDTNGAFEVTSGGGTTVKFNSDGEPQWFMLHGAFASGIHHLSPNRLFVAGDLKGNSYLADSAFTAKSPSDIFLFETISD